MSIGDGCSGNNFWYLSASVPLLIGWNDSGVKLVTNTLFYCLLRFCIFDHLVFVTDSSILVLLNRWAVNILPKFVIDVRRISYSKSIAFASNLSTQCGMQKPGTLTMIPQPLLHRKSRSTVVHLECQIFAHSEISKSTLQQIYIPPKKYSVS